MISAAVGRGKHILCDKPIALTLEEADEIIRLSREAGVKLMVPFNPRFQLPLIKVKKALDGGEVGDLASVFADKYGKLPTKIPGLGEFDWFLDPDQPEVGASWISASTPWMPCVGWWEARLVGYTHTSGRCSIRTWRWTTWEW